MNVLVTGGAGYIGTELVKSLAGREEVSKVVVYDNLARGNYNLFLDYPFSENEKVSFLQGDILDTRKLQQCFSGIDTVFHLAANVTTPFANTDPHLYEQVNHWGTADVGFAAEKAGVKRLIYVSSSSVYGASDQVLSEETPPNPRTYYGISKWRGETHLEPLKEKLDVLIVRCGNVYGYSHSMRFDAVINKFAFEANYFNRITIQGDGSQTRAFIHIDSVSTVLADLISAKIPSNVYNLVEENYSVLDVLDALKALKPELEFLFVDQHLTFRRIQIDTNLRLKQFVQLPEVLPLKTRLETFLGHFSF